MRRALPDPHLRYRDLIAARLDRPLTRVELRTLTGHLKKCAACQGVETEYRNERGLLRGLAAPIPPRDLWARTSASLDREVARAYRDQTWRRRLGRGSRVAQPSTALMTAVAAIGVSAAIMVLQLAPAIGPAASIAGRPTPLTIPAQAFAFIGLGPSDAAIYSTDVSQVCPTSAPLDCVENEKYVRTPLGLPPDVRAGNLALNPAGNQLAIVGHMVGEDMIGVVTMPPTDSQVGDQTDNSNNNQPTKSGSSAINQPQATNSLSGPDPVKTHAPDNGNPDPTPAPGATPDPGANGQPSAPPASAVPGLAVLSILDNVQSAGSAPDWSVNGEILAFSAMPDDGSTGPDVYTWSPGDARAQAITNDHESYFASWSGNRIVVSKIATGAARPHNFVIDPSTGEVRSVSGPQLWLPTVNTQRTQAVGWFGQLDTSGALPAPRAGALYLMDWTTVDPFAPNAAPQATPTPADQPAPTGQTDTSSATSAPNDSNASPAPNATAEPDATGAPTDGQAPNATAAPATPEPPADSANNAGAGLDALIPVEPDRDPRAAPVVDWQAHWSTDGQVLGVWIADSTGSTWGRLAVFAADPDTQLVTTDNALLPMTLARRGFSLGTNRVAWVGPSDENVDGELRIRTWGSDGVGGLRLKAPSQEQVVPAS